eukprot:1159564-Pelagomonas_calceolata.AAC.5
MQQMIASYHLAVGAATPQADSRASSCGSLETVYWFIGTPVGGTPSAVGWADTAKTHTGKGWGGRPSGSSTQHRAVAIADAWGTS